MKTALKGTTPFVRETWDNPIEFLLSCISLSVGLGNIWRFPAVAARNGGGVFLIPYLVVLLLIGKPMYYLEMCMGQFSRYGQVKVWNMAPILKGIGYGSLTAIICVTSYYCALMAITFFFFFASFSNPLPWTICDEQMYGNETCSLREVKGHLAQLYYDNVVFPQLKNIDNGLGGLNWKLAACLALSWLLVFLSLVKGIKSSGKVAYFTAIFPYFVLFVLLLRGVTLKGAGTGLLYFITPQWDRLLEPKVWYAAVEQCFFSLGTGFGPIIMFSSFNPFKRNVYKDVLIISFLDTATSLLAGCMVFSVMGYLVTVSNEEYGIDIKFQDIESGPALAFVLYPQAISTFSWNPQFFAVLFMLMLLTVALGTATSFVAGVITIICDQFPNLNRLMVVSSVCLLGFLSGLMYVTEKCKKNTLGEKRKGGLFILNLIDHFGGGIVIYIMAMLECAGVVYVYGLNNFCQDVEFMTGIKVGTYWKYCWGAIIPAGLFGILMYYLATEPEYTYNGIAYPTGATICGWLVTAFAISLIPVCAVHSILSMKGKNLNEKFWRAIRHTKKWGPQEPNIRRDWLQYKGSYEQEVKPPPNPLPIINITVTERTKNINCTV